MRAGDHEAGVLIRPAVQFARLQGVDTTVSLQGRHDTRGGPGSMASVIAAVAATTLQMAFGLMLVAAVSDLGFAAAEGDGAGTLIEGALLVALAAIGLRFPGPAARLLTRRGAVVFAAFLFAFAGMLDWGLQLHYSEVAPAIVGIAVIVSSPRWVLLTVIVSVLGYLAGLAALGHSIGWMFRGQGLNLVVNQVVDLVAYGAVVVLLVYFVKRFLTTVPAQLASAREGDGALTPELNAAVRGARLPLLERGDPVAITAMLSDGERDLLALLADGLVPKQAAVELSLSLAGVRSRIASAKRKTGCRTLEQLIALYAEGRDG